MSKKRSFTYTGWVQLSKRGALANHILYANGRMLGSVKMPDWVTRPKKPWRFIVFLETGGEEKFGHCRTKHLAKLAVEHQVHEFAKAVIKAAKKRGEI